jgi:hypothetical protein
MKTLFKSFLDKARHQFRRASVWHDTEQLRLIAASVMLLVVLVMESCSTPTLPQVARRRAARTERNKNDVTTPYQITDWDVLNFADEINRKLENRSHSHEGIRYGSAGAQTTLGALAGAAESLGWAVSTASMLGAGATYIFALGQVFNAKGHAQAYEQAFTDIQNAEADFYKAAANQGGVIPNQEKLTKPGAELYARVSKTLKVLDDVIAGTIPDLQDLAKAKGAETKK